jgi:hypothetical protein
LRAAHRPEETPVLPDPLQVSLARSSLQDTREDLLWKIVSGAPVDAIEAQLGALKGRLVDAGLDISSVTDVLQRSPLHLVVTPDIDVWCATPPPSKHGCRTVRVSGAPARPHLASKLDGWWLHREDCDGVQGEHANRASMAHTAARWLGSMRKASTPMRCASRIATGPSWAVGLSACMLLRVVAAFWRDQSA